MAIITNRRAPEPPAAKPDLHLVPRQGGRVVPFTRSVAS